MKAEPSSPETQTRALVVIGNFDGVHLGHQAVFREAQAEAAQRGLVARVLTFDPHPRKVISGQDPELLTRVNDRLELIVATFSGLDVRVEPFTRELSQLTPEGFALEVLVKRLLASVVLVGEDFRFGRGRSGDLRKLIDLGRELGFEARALPLVRDGNGDVYSSSRVRELVKQGAVVEAGRMLGRPHWISGTVARGDGRGRTLGFPTANISEVSQLLPAYGVYAVRAHLPGGRQVVGVMNHGPRPTVERPVATEVHLLEFDGDLYGSELRIEIVHRLRDVLRFASKEALVGQIAEDIERARELLR
jgi:riboflavin kinase / FMN adenylyltransferase